MPPTEESLKVIPRNTIAPFYLSISLIITCPEKVHQDVARLLFGLRRLRFPSEYTRVGGVRLVGPLPPSSARAPVAEPQTAQPQPHSISNRAQRIDQLLNELRELVQKVDDAPTGTFLVPPAQ